MGKGFPHMGRMAVLARASLGPPAPPEGQQERLLLSAVKMGDTSGRRAEVVWGGLSSVPV